MIADQFREVVGVLEAVVRGGELEAVAAKDEAAVRILNDDRGAGGRCVGQVKVEIGTEVEA